MRAGRLDRHITIQQPTEAQDTFGDPIKSGWTTFASVRAGKREMTARERFTAGQELSERSAIWVMRWLSGVTADMRIKDDRGELWDIQGTPEGFGRGRSLELPCIRRTETDTE